jgi:lipopolysaccharide biosynthesis glycosyltransferase
MIDRCACILTDLGYLFPSLLAGIQARKFLDPKKSDVIIVLFDCPPEKAELLTKICEQSGVTLILASKDVLQGFSSLYGRMFLSDLLPPHYRRVLYLDGDMQITGPLDDFIQTELPSGCDFAAAADPMAIEFAEGKPASLKLKPYFDGLGIKSSPAAPYFNSGTLLLNLEPFKGIARDAIAFSKTSLDKCLFLDQSALNHVGHTRFAPFSNRWNFPIFYRNCGVESAIAPRVYHFMSKPKPWDGNFPPWNSSFVTPYQELLAAHPELGSLLKKFTPKKHAKYLGQQYYKLATETVSWRFSKRRQIILEFNRAAKF